MNKITQSIEDLYHYPTKSSIIEMFQDENGKYHNDNGPAIITETAVYFINHGHDWSTEKYERFIRNLAFELYPEQHLAEAPFTQIESIIMAEKGWGEKRTFLSETWNNMNTKLRLGKISENKAFLKLFGDYTK